MRTVIHHNRFIKDARLTIKRGKDDTKLEHVLLAPQDNPLPAKYRPHKLTGEWQGCWECHIEPDWLLIYRYNEDELILLRTGTHSDLFD